MPFDNQHARTCTPQTPRERQSNHSSADDNDVPGLHILIVVEETGSDSYQVPRLRGTRLMTIAALQRPSIGYTLELQ